MRIKLTSPRLLVACGAAVMLLTGPTGCSKDAPPSPTESPSASGSEQAAAAPAAKDEPAAAATDEAPPAKQGLAALVSTKEPALIGPLAKIELGMTRAAAEAALPDSLGKGNTTFESEAYEGVDFNVFFNEGEVEFARVLFYDESAAEAQGLITAAWGAPVESTEGDRKVARWHNTETGVTATLRKIGFDGTTAELKFIQGELPDGE